MTTITLRRRTPRKLLAGALLAVTTVAAGVAATGPASAASAPVASRPVVLVSCGGAGVRAAVRAPATTTRRALRPVRHENLRPNGMGARRGV
jgi:hypothetical protein